jgi:starvation-inducible DNA-binding protein
MKRELRAKLTGLDPSYAKKMADALNVYLANLHLTQIKLHNFHWNIVGVDFIDFHEKLDELYEAVGEEIDTVAERIKMLGFYPLASMQEFLQYATLNEAPSRPYNSSTIAYAIVQDFAATARYLRELDEIAKETTDEYTVDIIANALGFLEKHVWFFDAYLTNMET